MEPSVSSAQRAFFRRNAWAVVLDMSLWQVANSMVSGTTVLPAFAATLTDSEVLIGLLGSVASGAWLLPQLFIASHVTRLPRKRPFMVRMALLRGPLFFPVALAAWLWAGSRPGLVMGLLLLMVTLFYAADASMSVPFFDMQAKGLPARRRGRIQGTAAFLGGVGGIVAGVLVRRILATMGYPDSYALLFVLGGTVFLVASIALAFMREAEPDPDAMAKAPATERPSTRAILASIPELLKSDPGFAWMVVARIVAGFAGLACAFYIVYGLRHLGLQASDAGILVSVQVAGLLGNGLVMGIVQDRFGPRAHQRLNMALSLVTPALVLVAAWIGPGPAVLPLYSVGFFVMGVYRSDQSLPYMNWIIEHASDDRRSLYVGVTNTLSALLMISPVLGGLIARQISFQAAFVVAMVFAVAGLVLSARVPSTRVQDGGVTS